MKNILSIRPAKTADIGSLVSLFVQMADYHHQLDHIWSKGDKESTEKFVRKLLKKKKDHSFLVLIANENVVGYATAAIQESTFYTDGKIGHIGSIFIEKRYRKFGLAKMAITEFTHWFREHNITYVALQVDIKNNIGTVAWKQLGFREWRLTLRKKISSK